MDHFVRKFALFIFIFAISFAIARSSEKTFDKQFSVAPGGTFVIKTDVGNVDIVGTDSKEVSVHAALEGRQRDIDEFTITAEQTSQGVEVTGRAARKSKWFNWGNNSVNISFTIKVPREYNLRMETSGGDIHVGTIQGTLNGGTSGGNIVLNNITGSVNLETSGGDIRVEKVTGQLHMETSGGDIRISDVKGDVDVNTSGGNVTLNMIEGKVRAETSGGNITMRVKESNKGVHAETSGGNIDIVLPKNISANIDAATSGGEVSCDFPITMMGKISESRVRGTVNGGGSVIYAHTSGGNVRIRGME